MATKIGERTLDSDPLIVHTEHRLEQQAGTATHIPSLGAAPSMVGVLNLLLIHSSVSLKAQEPRTWCRCGPSHCASYLRDVYFKSLPSLVLWLRNQSSWFPDGER